LLGGERGNNSSAQPQTFPSEKGTSMTDQTKHTQLETQDSATNSLPEPNVSLMERLKEWAGEISDPPIPARYDDTATNVVTGQRRTP
jgi:hypothetical protein